MMKERTENKSKTSFSAASPVVRIGAFGKLKKPDFLMSFKKWVKRAQKYIDIGGEYVKRC